MACDYVERYRYDWAQLANLVAGDIDRDRFDAEMQYTACTQRWVGDEMYDRVAPGYPFGREPLRRSRYGDY